MLADQKHMGSALTYATICLMLTVSHLAQVLLLLHHVVGLAEGQRVVAVRQLRLGGPQLVHLQRHALSRLCNAHGHTNHNTQQRNILSQIAAACSDTHMRRTESSGRAWSAGRPHSLPLHQSRDAQLNRSPPLRQLIVATTGSLAKRR